MAVQNKNTGAIQSYSFSYSKPVVSFVKKSKNLENFVHFVLLYRIPTFSFGTLEFMLYSFVPCQSSWLYLNKQERRSNSKSTA